MNVEFTRSFSRQYAALPVEIQKRARKTINVFLDGFRTKQYPKGIRAHKCGPFLSLSITMNYRVFVYPIADGVRFVFAGDHHDADKYLKQP